ncbi:laccase domain protein [Neiella marina]|uniref:Purine nucleoside phosphorylase n=1 Tax=Neiella marina TaxID=508461 RepID=A0A8J2XLN2_9GAMM|nr:laccase domain protein [Neiella marina]
MDDWQLPEQVAVVQTYRHGGVSQTPYDSMNVGLHVDDDSQAVATNRQRLQQRMPGCQDIHWLNQVHGTQVFHLNRPPRMTPNADAAISREPGQACTIMTADCLPVLICANDGSEVAAAHAGWRGLANGILEQTVKAMVTPADRLRVWLGPCIGPKQFQVGAEVRDVFIAQSPQNADAFQPSVSGKWLADLQLLAMMRLLQLDVSNISADRRCTYLHPELFFSYRRASHVDDKACKGVTGRMASAIWIKANA